jgi:hypothetical protein
MTPTGQNTSLIQRIEIALASDDLHAAEVNGLISAATAAEGKLQILIKQLRLLLDALTAKEAAAPTRQSFLNEPTRPHVREPITTFNEPKPPPPQPRYRQQGRARS